MSQYGIKEVMNFVLAGYNPNPLLRKPLVYVDYAQITEIENAGERLDISGGRGNGRLMSFDHSKTTAINLTLPLVDLKMLALISGDEIVEKISDIFKREVICVGSDGTIELSKTPVGESLYVYTLEKMRDNGKQLTLTDETVGVDEYSITGKVITVNETSHPEGTQIVVYYHTTTSEAVTSLKINPKKFPQAISFYGDALFRGQFDEVDEVYHVVGHKGRIRPNYTLNMSATDASVLTLTIDMYDYVDTCGQSSSYLEWTKDEE